MAKHNQIIDTVDECITNGVNNKILHLITDDDYADGRTILVRGKRLINFASYSYMGLETDPRLKQGGIDAIEKYGTQFGASRAYVSIRLYDELESLFSQMYSKPALIAPSTTLAHMAALPVLIRDEDVVLLDQHVHSSVQTTIKMVKSRGVPVELLRHNDLNRLEERIKELRTKHDKIWYLLDGVYSMYGDYAPLKELYELMNKYPQFYCYVDDAHGMSWAGRNGTGYAMSQMEHHPQLILITSMNKAFAAAGGAMILPDKETHRRIRTCGGTLIFSTPIQPPMLGVGVASAKIHLSDEIYTMQEQLKNRVAYCQFLLEKHNLPVVSNDGSPIFFVGTGLPRVGYNMIRRLMNEGFYVSIGLFPAVSMKCTGLRFCVTLHQDISDIEQLVEAIAFHYPIALAEEGKTDREVRKAFKLALNDEIAAPALYTQSEKLKVTISKSITEVNKTIWDTMFAKRGSFDWNGMQFLENTFTNNPEPENNWEFCYVTVTDDNKNIVASTFFTATLCKDDMFSPAPVSQEIEEKRKTDKYHMCSKVVMMGSLLSEGEHLYIDKSHPDWRNALLLILQKANQMQEATKANTISLRDFAKEDIEVRDLLITEGYVTVDLPDAHIVNKNMLEWASAEEYLSILPYKARHNVRRDAVRYADKYEVGFITTATDEELDHIYNLYKNVKNKSFELNTFSLSKKAMANMINHPNWEVMTLTLKDEFNDRAEKKPIAAGFIYKNETTYCPMIVGIDYHYLFAFKNYKQMIYQVVKRAKELNLETVYLGFTASMEKQKFGAIPVPKVAYIQTNDSFNMEVLELNKTQEHNKPKFDPRRHENAKEELETMNS